MKKIIIMLVCILIVSAAGIFAKGDTAVLADSYDSDNQIESLLSDPSFKYLSMDFKKTNQEVSISKQQAIDIVRKEMDYIKGNPKISAAEVIFTDKTSGNIVPKNTPVWLVSITGISIPVCTYGPGPMRVNKDQSSVIQDTEIVPKSYSEINIILDSKTGNQISSFSFR